MLMRSVVFWVITRRRVVIIYHTTLCNNPEDHRFQNYMWISVSRGRQYEGSVSGCDTLYFDRRVLMFDRNLMLCRVDVRSALKLKAAG
jgi:hypothetical protein